MKSNNVKISIIIVHYNVERELMFCISSILESKLRQSYEIIVVDNDEEPRIEYKLKEKFKEVRYVKSPKNLGFGGGNNLGASHAQGEFLFFLNPDTLVKKNAIDRLVAFLETHEKVGIVAPIFLDSEQRIYPSQGSEELTPLSAVFALSFINKIIPSNPISERYFLLNWDKKGPRKVGNVPGTAFLIRKNLFERIGKFDENFFLYFEEFDLCKRIRKLGYDLFVLPSSRIVHFWGRSTNKSSLNIKEIFSKSKFYYFKKHYGIFSAVVVQFITGLSKLHLFLTLAIVFSAFLRFYKLQELMPFIGDQGWFYLSARDMLLTGTFPLVGIPSSHPWIHQGPLWTYMLAIVLWIGNFNPVMGSYLTAFLGVVTVWFVYKIGLLLFSQRVGIISALLYSASPLATIGSRMAYHTNPIPLFTILFIWSVLKWTKGNAIYFAMAVFFLGVLYNLELATAVLWLILGLIGGFGVWRKKIWARQLFTKRIICFSLVAFILPMIPVFIYDLEHGFPQTLKFAAWGGYRILGFLGFINTGTSYAEKSSEMIQFFVNQYKLLIFYQNGFVAFFIFILSAVWVVKTIYLNIVKNKLQTGSTILLLWTIVPIIIFFVNKTPSDAYMPILFPAIILLTASSFELLMYKKILKVLVVIIISIILLMNSNTLLSNNFFSAPTFKERLLAAKKIVDQTAGKKYAIVGEGPGSEFESFTMNYEYLTWWLGHSPSKDSIGLTVVVKESKNEILVKLLRNNLYD